MHDAPEPHAVIEVRGLNGGSLVVRIKSRLFDVDDWWDGNWLRAEIATRCAGFSGTIYTDFHVDEIARLKEELQALYDTLRGTVTFEHRERQLDLTFEGDGLGHIFIRGVARANASGDNALSFALEVDQTILSGVIHQVSDLLEKYPIRGSAPR